MLLTELVKLMKVSQRMGTQLLFKHEKPQHCKHYGLSSPGTSVQITVTWDASGRLEVSSTPSPQIEIRYF